MSLRSCCVMLSPVCGKGHAMDILQLPRQRGSRQWAEGTKRAQPRALAGLRGFLRLQWHDAHHHRVLQRRRPQRLPRPDRQARPWGLTSRLAVADGLWTGGVYTALRIYRTHKTNRTNRIQDKQDEQDQQDEQDSGQTGRTGHTCTGQRGHIGQTGHMGQIGRIWQTPNISSRHPSSNRCQNWSRHGSPNRCQKWSRHGSPNHCQNRSRHGSPNHCQNWSRHGSPNRCQKWSRHGSPNRCRNWSRHGSPNHCQNGLRQRSLLLTLVITQTSQIISGRVGHMNAPNAYGSTNKIKIVWIETELFCKPGRNCDVLLPQSPKLLVNFT